MTNKYYVVGGCDHGSTPGLEGLATMEVMELPAQAALRKAELIRQIFAAQQDINGEYQRLHDLERKYSEKRDSEKWREYESKKIVGPLQRESNRINGPSLHFIVPAGKYLQGQVLSEIPSEAVPVKDFFRKLKEEGTSG